MNRQPAPPVSRTRGGYTLFEVLLALGLSSLLMILVYGAMNSFWQLSSLGQIDSERCQLARTLIRRMEMDIRSVTYTPPKQSTASSGGQAADEGAGNLEDGAGDLLDSQTTLEIQEDETYLTANVHLIGGPQALEMIVLRPTRNRTGSLADEVFEDSQSDRRRVGYMFFTSGTPGLYYRNVDQQIEQVMELQGLATDPIEDYQLLAAEVADVRFQYLDGTTSTWVEEWHSRDLGRLPRAIKITLQFHPAEMASSHQLRQAGASGSTEIFQTVVHVPLSDVSLAL